MPLLSWRTSPRRCIEDVRLFVYPRRLLTWPCSVIFIAVYNKCVILLSKWVTLNVAPCRNRIFLLERVRATFSIPNLHVVVFFVCSGRRAWVSSVAHSAGDRNNASRQPNDPRVTSFVYIDTPAFKPLSWYL